MFFFFFFFFLFFFRKFETPVKIISDCNISEKLAEYDIHCLPCSDTNDVIYLFNSVYEIMKMLMTLLE